MDAKRKPQVAGSYPGYEWIYPKAGSGGRGGLEGSGGRGRLAEALLDGFLVDGLGIDLFSANDVNAARGLDNAAEVQGPGFGALEGIRWQIFANHVGDVVGLEAAFDGSFAAGHAAIAIGDPCEFCMRPVVTGEEAEINGAEGKDSHVGKEGK